MGKSQREFEMEVKTENIKKRHWYGTHYETRLSISYTDVHETKSACQVHTPGDPPGSGPIYFSSSRVVEAGGEPARVLGISHLDPPSSQPPSTIERSEEKPPPPIPKVQLGTYMNTYIDSSKSHQFLEFLKRKNAANGGRISSEDEYELKALNRYLLEFRNENKALRLLAPTDSRGEGFQEDTHDGTKTDDAIYDKMATAMTEQQTLPLQRQVEPQTTKTLVNEKKEENSCSESEDAPKNENPSIFTHSEMDRDVSNASQAPSPLENEKEPDPNISFKQFTIVLKRRFGDSPEEIKRFTTWIQNEHPVSLGQVKETDKFQRWELFYNYAIWVSRKDEHHHLKEHYGDVPLQQLATRLDHGAEHFHLDEILDFMKLTNVQRKHFERFLEFLSKEYVAKNHGFYALDEERINKEFAPSQPWTIDTVKDLYKVWKNSGCLLRYRMERSWEYIKDSWKLFVEKLKAWVSNQKAKCFQKKTSA